MTKAIAQYDQWYQSGPGQWIGRTEWQRVRALLRPACGDTILDAGCGSGWFTRQLACESGINVTAIDRNHEAIAYARQQDGFSDYQVADMRQLPFADNQFSKSVSITALNFALPWHNSLAELVRVSRRQVVLAVLHRNSLLYSSKGKAADSRYHGAHWLTRAELQQSVQQLATQYPIQRARFEYAIWQPSATPSARKLERRLPRWLPFGSILLLNIVKS